MISMVCTSTPIWASTAAWYPDPAPTSSTLSPGSTSSRSVISATVYGCEIVCPWPMGRGWSSYALARCCGSTSICRGTVAIARSTAGSSTPLAAMSSSTIC